MSKIKISVLDDLKDVAEFLMEIFNDEPDMECRQVYFGLMPRDTGRSKRFSGMKRKEVRKIRLFKDFLHRRLLMKEIREYV